MKVAKFNRLSKLQGLLREKHVTYRKLACATGISLNAVCNKINGFSVFNLEEVQKIVDVLEINPGLIPVYFFNLDLQNATEVKQ